jgi:hypothetical protein
VFAPAAVRHRIRWRIHIGFVQQSPARGWKVPGGSLHWQRESNCFLSVQNRPPYPAYFKDCTNRCDANHSACVDFALTLSRNVQ